MSLVNTSLRFLAVVITFFGMSVSVTAEPVRKALIIGNAKYTQVSALKNSVNDAVLIDKTLRARGFQTTVLTDATRRQMQTSIQEFAQQLDSNSVGLFYYAGHGVEIGGTNFLLPVDANIKSEADVEYEAVDANRILSVFKRSNNGLNLMILDACRDNPFSSDASRSLLGQRGLVRMQPASGSLVLYAAEPGHVASDNPNGSNGLFTLNLVDSIEQPGLKIEEVFKRTALKVRNASGNKQTPYQEGVIFGDFIFTKSHGSVNPPVAPPPLVSPPLASDNELEFWNEVSRVNTADAYKQYLEQFPKGIFSMIALMKLEN